MEELVKSVEIFNAVVWGLIVWVALAFVLSLLWGKFVDKGRGK